MSSKLVQLVDDWDEETRFDASEREVLKKLSIDELGKRFGLDLNESGMFWYIMKEELDPLFSAYGVDKKNGGVFLEQLQEAIHQEFDGPYSQYDRIVIRSFLADVTWAMYQDIKDREMYPTGR